MQKKNQYLSQKKEISLELEIFRYSLQKWRIYASKPIYISQKSPSFARIIHFSLFFTKMAYFCKKTTFYHNNQAISLELGIFLISHKNCLFMRKKAICRKNRALSLQSGIFR